MDPIDSLRFLHSFELLLAVVERETAPPLGRNERGEFQYLILHSTKSMARRGRNKAKSSEPPSPEVVSPAASELPGARKRSRVPASPSDERADTATLKSMSKKHRSKRTKTTPQVASANAGPSNLINSSDRAQLAMEEAQIAAALSASLDQLAPDERRALKGKDKAQNQNEAETVNPTMDPSAQSKELAFKDQVGRRLRTHCMH